jgi:hypothetical protein
MTTSTNPSARSRSDDTTANASIAFGAAGLLPVLPFIGSVVALVLGIVALQPRDAIDDGTRSRARIGVTLGVIGILAPVVVLIVYCGVLGYPFPIHRYNGD